jgi:hypothetical protein
MPDLLAALDLPRFHRHADYVGVWAIEPMAGEALLDRARRTDWPAHLRLSAEQPARRPRPARPRSRPTTASGSRSSC